VETKLRRKCNAESWVPKSSDCTERDPTVSVGPVEYDMSQNLGERGVSWSISPRMPPSGSDVPGPGT
jgi:hypothetical protein